jgi:putative FmdB family regulatory protein
MPLYEYLCKKCGHRFERIQKFSDPLVKKCPECGGVVEQVLSPPAVQFKGSGWYVTDYARKSSATGKGQDSAAAGGDSAKPESAESKSEAKSEAKSETKKESQVRKSPAKK